VRGDGTLSTFLLVDNGPNILHTASEHSSFVFNLVAAIARGIAWRGHKTTRSCSGCCRFIALPGLSRE
jgi:hypothetical protein